MSIRGERLLALLDDQPQYGVQLNTAFEASTGGVWTLTIGQLYSALDRLGRDERVRVGPGADADRRTHAITDAARSELASWLSTVVADAPPPRDELLLKVLLALGAASVDAAEVIQAQRTAIVESLLARRRRFRVDAHNGDAQVALIVVGALIVRLEGDLRWLDLYEERLMTRRSSR